MWRKGEGALSLFAKVSRAYTEVNAFSTPTQSLNRGGKRRRRFLHIADDADNIRCEEDKQQQDEEVYAVGAPAE